MDLRIHTLTYKEHYLHEDQREIRSLSEEFDTAAPGPYASSSRQNHAKDWKAESSTATTRTGRNVGRSRITECVPGWGGRRHVKKELKVLYSNSNASEIFWSDFTLYRNATHQVQQRVYTLKPAIIVQSLPETITENEIRDHFSRFGTILGILVQPDERLAIIKFENWNSVREACNSTHTPSSRYSHYQSVKVSAV